MMLYPQATSRLLARESEGGITINQTNYFGENYKARDGAAAVRDLNRQLGRLYGIGGDAVRQFKLLNAKGEQWDLTTKDSWFQNPSGLGLEQSISSIKAGYDWVETRQRAGPADCKRGNHL